MSDLLNKISIRLLPVTIKRLINNCDGQGGLSRINTLVGK